MRLLLITAYFPPDSGSAAHLFHDLGRSLAGLGHSVSVVTGFPGYHAQGDLSAYGGRATATERIDGLEVHRVRVPEIARNTPIGRGLWQLACMRAFARAAEAIPGADAAIVYSPPLPLGAAALRLRRRRGVPCVINVQDLFPQSAIDLGVLKNPILIAWFRRLEHRIYASADAVTVHSSGNRDHVLARGGRSERTFVLPNAVDTEAVTPGRRTGDLRAELGIAADAFVASFGGIMGFSQDLDTIIAAADRLRDRGGFVFVLAGEGVEKERCRRLSESLGLTHSVRWLPMLPRERYPDLLAASDVCLTTLRADVKTPVVPSKILSAMAAGRAVVAAVDGGGDAPKLIAEAGCGVVVPPEDPAALATAIIELSRDPETLSRYGASGRDYAVRHLSPASLAERYAEICQRIGPGSPPPGR